MGEGEGQRGPLRRESGKPPRQGPAGGRPLAGGEPTQATGSEDREQSASDHALVFTEGHRVIIWRSESGDDFHEAVECALRADGSSPAADFLDELSRGERWRDPDFRQPPDAEQIHDYAKLLSKIEYVGQHGEPAKRGDVNDLDDGVWEFRHGKRRLTYWDTDGVGNCTPKPKVEDIRTLDPPRSPDSYWWYPDMDAVLRLGCGWEKDDRLAPPEKIYEALMIREEDAARDRQA